MKRHVAHVLTGLSLVLCLVVVVMWVRSYFKEDAVQVSKQSMTGLWHEEETWQAWSGWGGLSLCWGRNGGDLIAPDALRRLAQPFERLQRGVARGSGLGLSIVRAVAEAHGGTLHLATPPAGGLEAEVRLPALVTVR